jgi:flagellar basal body-associated protein FliL
LGLAIVSLIVLVLLGALAGLILTRVFGAAAARNQKRPGGKTKAGEI